MNQIKRDMILVIDDNLPMRKALTETLKYLNYETLEAENGIEALEIIEKLCHNGTGNHSSGLALIMSDLTMPVMDGKELFDELKKRDIHLPFIMLSGYMSDQALEDLKKRGLSGWLKKPADIEEIAGLLEKVLR
jgi:CheY-like chemotaxis protein